ncbi:MAG: carboxylating nicotinate-nucleotide diphosphorylase [Bacteroidetes bacterium]|nr:carboxylating nicotinate-nucleotide diphosphorylase [Bacteroidota bacterium]MCL5025702.1 carboxylating nicotinate-nucleotide diphosphorylase [Chloroflexota bacterium]
MDLPSAEVQRIVERALAEDLGWGDVTTQALIDPAWTAQGKVIAKETGVLCGIQMLAMVFRAVDPDVQTDILAPDGATVFVGQTVANIRGSAASLLMGERTALNFLQRLSGIATETRRYVDAVQGLPVRIVETRKTTPGLRLLEKYAVRVGGGHNHRQNLSDAILIKDNHLAALRSRGMSFAEIVALAQQKSAHTITVEVEVEAPEEAAQAAEAGADTVMLDNMGLEEMRRAVELVGGRALIEASGGVRLDTVRAIAETGVDLISVGALTHSVKALDFSIEFSI